MATKAHIGLCKYGRIYETGCETKKGLTLKVINPFLLHASLYTCFHENLVMFMRIPKNCQKT